jgi:hypothetical protein
MCDRKTNRVSRDHHGSVGSAVLNIAIFDTCLVSQLEVKKHVSLTTATKSANVIGGLEKRENCESSVERRRQIRRQILLSQFIN